MLLNEETGGASPVSGLGLVRRSAARGRIVGRPRHRSNQGYTDPQTLPRSAPRRVPRRRLARRHAAHRRFPPAQSAGRHARQPQDRRVDRLHGQEFLYGFRVLGAARAGARAHGEARGHLQRRLCRHHRGHLSLTPARIRVSGEPARHSGGRHRKRRLQRRLQFRYGLAVGRPADARGLCRPDRYSLPQHPLPG